nr:LOW QUALITY PROTEIN: zinc finger MYM-type protein 1-like [Hydra vulgaris]
MPRSVLQYIDNPNEGQCSSKDSTLIQARLVVEESENEASNNSTFTVDMEKNDQENEAESPQVLEITVLEKHGGKTNFKIFSDVSFWKLPLQDHLRIEIIKKGSSTFQNKDGPFNVVQRNVTQMKGHDGHLSSKWFYKQMKNGEKILRSWMVYSPNSGNLYCFCCLLFASITNLTSKFVTGFQKWWKLNPKVYEHESSDNHLRFLEKWKILETNLKSNNTIDAEIISFTENEKKKWRNILSRLLDVTLFLAKQNLPFRGHQEDESSLNKGNLLELVDLLSMYDPILKEQLIKLRESYSKVSYLSPKIQNEFISFLASHVKDKLIEEIKSARYFSMMFDSTPDISNVDQMSEVIRYIKIENKKVEIKEAFFIYRQKVYLLIKL